MNSEDSLNINEALHNNELVIVHLVKPSDEAVNSILDPLRDQASSVSTHIAIYP